MERREDLHHHGCSIAKQTILTTHPSGLQTRVSVELANFDALCVHSERSTKTRPMWEGSPFLTRRILGGVSAHGTPVLGRRSDAVNEGRLSQQCTPVMRRREVDSPGGSPLPVRRCDEELETEVDNSVISGWLKFRDNKRIIANMDSQYIIIKLIKDLPHPSFPRVLCVPETWITVFFPKNDKVAVILPAEPFSITKNRIKSKEKPEKLKWGLKIAVILLRADDHDIAYETARELNREAMLEEAQLQQANSEDQLQSANKSDENQQVSESELRKNQHQNTANAEKKSAKNLLQRDNQSEEYLQESGNESEENTYQNEAEVQLQRANSQEVNDNQQENENELKENAVQLEKKSAESQRQSEVTPKKDSQENQQASESELGDNQHQNAGNAERYSEKNLPQRENQSEEHQQDSESELGDNQHQNAGNAERYSEKNLPQRENQSEEHQQDSESELGDNQHQNAGNAERYSEKNLPQRENQSEEHQQDSENESEENTHRNEVDLEENLADNQQQYMTDEEDEDEDEDEESEENSADKTWHSNIESSDESSSYVSSEESEQSSDEKSKRPKKRAKHLDSEYQPNIKKPKLMKTSYSNNLNTPSTSKVVIPRQQSNLYKKKKKRITVRKFLKRLSLVCKILGEKFTELYGFLQSLGSIFNKLIELHSKFLRLHSLLFSENDSMDSDNSYKIKLQTEKINKYLQRDDKQSKNNNVNENISANCDFRSTNITDINYSIPVYEYPDNTDKSMKWTLIHEEFKPKPGLVELMPGSGIYIDDVKLQICLKEAKKARYEPCFKKLAKLLLFEIFKPEAIRKCSLFPKWKEEEKLRLDHYASCILMLFVKDFCSKQDLGEKMDEILTIKAIQKKMYDFKNKCINEEWFGSV